MTLGLIAVNVLAFLWELSLGPRLEPTIQALGTVPADVVAALARGDWLELARRLLLPAFLHGGLLHLGGNMLYLWVFGHAIEDRFGHLRYLTFYLAAAAAAGLAQTFVDPTSQVPMIGASGAVAGVLGAYFALYPGAWVSVMVPVLFLFWTVPMPAFVVLGLWFLIQVFNGLLSLGVETVNTAGVAWFAHIGGFLAGLVVGPLMPAAHPRRPAYQRLGPSSGGGRGRSPPLLGLLSILLDAVLLLLLTRLALILLDVPPRGPAGLIHRLSDPFLRLSQEVLSRWGLEVGPGVSLLLAMAIIYLAGMLVESLLYRPRSAG